MPLLASPSSAEITEVVYDQNLAFNTNSALQVTVKGTGTPYNPAADKVVIRRPGTTDLITCTTSPPPASTNAQLAVTCDVRGAAPGIPHDVIVNRPPDAIDTEPEQVDDVTVPAPDELKQNAITFFGGQPTISTISPASRAQNSPAVSATITGTNLSRGSVVDFLVGGAPDPGVTFTITGTSTTMTTLTGTLTVTGSSQTGPHDVRVRNTDNAVATRSGGLVVNPGPVITELSPPSVGQNATNKVVTIKGSGFQPGVTVTLASGSPTDVTLGATTRVDSETLTVPVTAGAGATGTRTIVVTNTDSGAASSGLVISPAPTITSSSPATRGQNSPPQNIVLSGNGFVATAERQTQFALDPATGVTIHSAVVHSPTAATLNVSVAPDAPVGARTIVTTNFDGGNARTNSNASHLTVTSGPAPTSVSPGSRVRGFSGNVTINGSSFSTTAGPGLDMGPGIAVNGTTVISSNAFTANITIDPAAAQGARQVRVTNVDGGVGSCVCFTVDALSVTSTFPSGVLNGSPRTITINGAGFDPSGTPTVVMTPVGNAPYQPSIPGSSVTVAPTGSSLTATFDFTFAAPLGYSVRVTNPNGDSGGCTNCFSVLSEKPTVTSVNPASKVQGSQNQTITVNGSSFSNGAALSFERAGITVDSVTLLSPTQLTAVIDIAPGTSTLVGDVTVTLPVGGPNGSGTCNDCFTVTLAPTLAQANPSTLGQGSTRSITFTGSGFASGATLTFGNPGVSTVGNPTVVNATTLTATVAVAEDTETGPVSTSVVNPDGGIGTCAACLTVNGSPTVTDVTPDKGGVGTSLTVQIAGTSFAPGTPVVTAGSGIAVTNPNRVSDTLVTATFTISSAATKGPRDVVVTLTDGGSATCEECFKVVTAPTFGAISPAASTRGRSVDVTITGTEFSVDPKPTLSFGPGITVDSIGTVTATTIPARITIDPDATTGARGVTVTNPDGGSATCLPDCFTVNLGPTIASLAPSSIARGRNNVPVTITGENFASDSTVSFGEGVTIVGTPTVTVNEGAADQISATVNVSPSTSVGDRAVTITNPSDGNATGGCDDCLTVTAGRAMVVEIFDTKGTASTTDDVLTDKPVSGTAHRVVVTAKNGETGSAPTDTTFTGPVTLSNTPVDGRFVPGTCSAAVSGVATCTGVVFGDLGSRNFTAAGSGNDSDRRGSVAIVTQAAGLAFTAAPTAANIADTVTFTVRPTTPVAGANIDGYTAQRTLALTGTGASRSGGSLDCDDAVCSFTVKWTEPGAKTVRVSDNGTPSRSTPTVTVTVSPVGLFKALSPTRILDTRRSDDTDGFRTPIGSNRFIDVQVTGRGGVPSTGVSAVVVNVTVDRPTAGGYLTVFPTGTARPTTSTLNFNRNDIVANLAVARVGNGGKISIYNFNGNTSTILDVVGYYTTTTTGAGGRLVAIEPERIFDTRFGSRLAPGETRVAAVTNRGGVPAADVDSVILSVSALSPTANAFLTVYPANVARPLASTLNFRAGNNVGNLIYAKVSDNGEIRIYNPAGSTHVTLDVVGYVKKTGEETLGRFVSLSPARVLDTRGRSNSPIVGKIGSGGVIAPTLVGVGGVPATGVSAVVINLTSTESTTRSYFTAYPEGAAPNTSNVHFNAGQNFANLVVVKLGEDGKIRLRNNAGQAHAIIDVVGYLTT